MKARNYHVHSTPEEVKRIADEYEFIGRAFKILAPDHLVLLAYPPKKEKKKKVVKDENERDNRGRRPQASKVDRPV